MSCVIGVKDPYKIQRVKAFVVLRPGYQPSQKIKDEIMELCKKQVAKYALPYEIEIRDSLPKTLVGKIAYTVLENEENKKII
jgi:long-chain acyl-CoA synthetase